MGRILLVDDSRTARKRVRHMLESHGHQIVGEAGNGEQAIDLYKELRPDLVLMDVVMPVMGGMECLKKIRNIDMWARIIMVSAVGTQTEMDEASEYGCLDYVTKPYDERILLNSIHRALMPASEEL